MLNEQNADLGNAKNGFSIRRHILVLGLTTAIFFAPTLASMPFTMLHAAPIVGTSAAVQGSVFVSTAGAERKAQVKEEIKLQDQITTKQDSALQILLLDQSTFTVGQNCRMIIDKFVYDPSTNVGEVAATVTKGAFRFMSGNIGKKNPTNATISTPSATIGIRGTFFEGIVGIDAIALAQLGGIPTAGSNSGAASLIILRGPGPNSNTLDTPGALTISTAGGTQSVTVPNYAIFDPGNGEPPIGPFLVTPAMQEYLDFFLRSSPNGPQENPIELQEDVGEESGQALFNAPLNPDEEFIELIDGIQDSLNNDYFEFMIIPGYES